MPISTVRGVALYVGALLGPGLLVLPGLAVTLAGPASILAWVGLLALSGLVAIVFARLGVAHPAAGGVARYARLGLGDRAGRAVAWLFLAGIVSGTPVVCVMGAGYLGLGRVPTVFAAAALLAGVLLIQRRGAHTSTAVQLALVAVLIAMILAGVASAVPAFSTANWTPFAPHGWPAIGTAATTLMLSFVGWEAIAPLTDRFADPARQLPRVIAIAFGLTAVVYLALAAATVGALGTGSSVPLADLFTLSIGRAGPVVAACGAIVLTLGAVNAYTTGGAELARTVSSSSRWFRSALLVSTAVTFAAILAGVLDVAKAITVPAMFFLLVYLGCTISALRLLTGVPRLAAAVSTGAILIVLAFAGWSLIPPVLVAAVALAWPRAKAPVLV